MVVLPDLGFKFDMGWFIAVKEYHLWYFGDMVRRCMADLAHGSS